MVHAKANFPVALLLLLLCAGTRSASSSEDEGAVVELVQQSQRAGFQRHDFEKYIAAWDANGQIVGGRLAHPGKYDTKLSRAQIEATRRLRFRAAPPTELAMSFSNVASQIEGDRAEVRYRTTIEGNGAVEVVDELYRLRKVNGEWKITENRWWPVEMGRADSPTKLDEAVWQAMDAQIARLDQAGDLAAKARALFSAFRFTEAYATAKSLTGDSPDDAEAWILRGRTALFAGDAEDAVSSYQKALAIDPAANVPEFVQADDPSE
ncbi:MAG: hypothetical protein WDZ59_07420 [Pirellulales bacterium]